MCLFKLHWDLVYVLKYKSPKDIKCMYEKKILCIISLKYSKTYHNTVNRDTEEQ